MIKGILFDKDGTLIDFSLWRNVGIELVNNVLKENGLYNDEKLYKRLIKTIGIKDNGVDPLGALAYRTHDEVANALYFILKQYNLNLNLNYNEFKVHVADLLGNEVLKEDIEFKEFTDKKNLFENVNIGLQNFEEGRFEKELWTA